MGGAHPAPTDAEQTNFFMLQLLAGPGYLANSKQYLRTGYEHESTANAQSNTNSDMGTDQSTATLKTVNITPRAYGLL